MPAAARPSDALSGPLQPLSEGELVELQHLLDAVPPPLEPLDVSMLDGYLCGVLVQPTRVPEAQWLAHVFDVDGRALPKSVDAAPMHALIRRRHRELDDAIARRDWFDPLVFELSAEEDGDESVDARDAVLPWVAGFATAMECFPALGQMDEARQIEPLALLYRHLDPDDLEDADALLEEIESLEPAADLEEAVEGLVRATLLLADVGRPVAAAAAGGASAGRSGARSGQRSGGGSAGRAGGGAWHGSATTPSTAPRRGGSRGPGSGRR
jgi:uncharacterized protein